MDLIVNYATAFAYAAFTGDIVIQIAHIYKRKSSKDLALRGIFVRFIAHVVLLIRFFAIQDFWLIFGQGIFTATYLFYFGLLVFYRK